MTQEINKTKKEIEKLELEKANGHEIDYSKLSWNFIIVNSLIVLFLTCLAGLVSGLTVGYLSIDELVLELRTIGGNDEEKADGAIIQDVLSDRHRLLVSLLLTNAAAMESLPIFLNKLVPEWAAIIVSTTLVLFVGEVIPQAYCCGPDQLKIAAKCAPLTKNIIWILSPFNIFLGKFLDNILGKHSKSRLMNTDLRILIELHTHSALKKLNLLDPHGHNNISHEPQKNEDIKPGSQIEMKEITDDHDEIHDDDFNNLSNDKPLDLPRKLPKNSNSKLVLKENQVDKSISNDIMYTDYGLNDEQANLMVSAIEMKDKKAIEVMIPINRTYMISYDDPLDSTLLSIILEKGFSRIPVYTTNNPSDIIGLVRIKQLIGKDLNTKKSMRQHQIQLKKPLVISPRMNLLELLKEFKNGKSHMAFITENVKELNKKLDYSCGNNRNEQRNKSEDDSIKVLGIITLEDIIEKMINIEILDEDDYDNINKVNLKDRTKGKFLT